MRSWTHDDPLSEADAIPTQPQPGPDTLPEPDDDFQWPLWDEGPEQDDDDAYPPVEVLSWDRYACPA